MTFVFFVIGLYETDADCVMFACFVVHLYKTDADCVWRFLVCFFVIIICLFETDTDLAGWLVTFA